MGISSGASKLLKPKTINQSFQSNTPLTTNTPVAVYSSQVAETPVTVMAANFVSLTNSDGIVVLIANENAPASITDGVVILSSDNYNVVGTLRIASGSLKNEVVIPLSTRLWWVSNQAENPQSFRHVLYNSETNVGPT